MTYTLGVILIGGHFLICAYVANYLSEHQSFLAFIAFMGFAASTGVLIIKLQSSIEMFIIRRHVKKKPGSGWRVVAGPHS